MKFWLPLIMILAMSLAASASTDIVGRIGIGVSGFGGGMPLAGRWGGGTPPPPNPCGGVIDTSVGCPLPMLGM